MNYSQQVWNQLKNLTADKIIRALEKSGWALDTKPGAIRIYIHQDGRRVSIHYHPTKTYGQNLLKGL